MRRVPAGAISGPAHGALSQSLYVVQQFACATYEDIDMQNPEELTGLALEYAFLKAIHCEIVGHPEGPFALYEKDRDVVLIFCHSANIDVINTRLTTNAADIPLSVVQDLGATFSVKDKVVTCTLDGHQGNGDSYMEAAMRAYLTRLNAKASPN